MRIVFDKEINLEQGIKQIDFALNQLIYVAGGKVQEKNFYQQLEEIDREIANFKLEIDADGTLFGGNGSSAPFTITLRIRDSTLFSPLHWEKPATQTLTDVKGT